MDDAINISIDEFDKLFLKIEILKNFLKLKL